MNDDRQHLTSGTNETTLNIDWHSVDWNCPPGVASQFAKASEDLDDCTPHCIRHCVRMA